MPRWARWSAYWGVIVLSLAFAAFVVLNQGRGDDVLRTSDSGLLSGAQPAASPSPSSSSSSPSPSASPSPSSLRSAGKAGRQQKVLFVGDAYLAYAASPARAACADLKWRCYFDLRAESGYTAGKRYISRLAADRRYAPDVVVVTGGRSDVGRTGVAQAAQGYLTALVQQFPKAELLVLEPFWNDDVTYDAVADVRAYVRAAAGRVGATWVPTDGWLKGSDKFLQGGQRLSLTGQSELRTQLQPALVAGLAAAAKG